MDNWIDLFGLQRQLREGLAELFPDRVWVKAELSSVNVRTNGHCYLELSQSDGFGVVAKARAVIWRSQYRPLASRFRDATGSDILPGMELLVRCQVSYSEIYGMTLVIDDIDPETTLGAAELARRKTVEKLQGEGLLDKQKSLPEPALPYRLAVVSAPDAAGYGDFRRHLQENEYGFVFDVRLFEAMMQGASAPASITDALECIECSGESYDAVLILRGGGSALDLACFDDYGLAFAIANFPIPVWTAIGHDRDHHVADMVAYDHVKTPTALADAFIAGFASEDERISSLGNRVKLGLSARLSAEESRVDNLALRISAALTSSADAQDMRLDSLRARMVQAYAGKVLLQQTRLDQLASRIAAADPLALLDRGYTLVTDGAGALLRSAGDAAAGDVLTVRLRDGRIEVRVEAVERQ